jgi:secreted trypsin-like serine protease
VGKRLLTAACALASVLTLAGGAAAITGGSPTGPNRYTNVGALYASAPSQGVVDPKLFCSGTLVAPGAFLTAAHCVIPIVTTPDATAFVSFSDHPDAKSLITATDIVIDPAFQQPEDAHDIAIVYFPAAAAAGIKPVALPPLNYLDSIAKQTLKKDLSFIDVGYGLTSIDAQVDGIRRFADSGAAKLKDGKLILSQQENRGFGGTCTGDSGGPQFLGDVQVSITLGGDKKCTRTGGNLRLDAGTGRDFLISQGIIPR